MLRWRVARDTRKEVLAEVRTNDPDMEKTNHYLFNWTVKDAFMKRVQANSNLYYTNLDAEEYWIAPDASPALSERLEKVVDEVEAALPNILNLTNQLAGTLSNASALAANLNGVALNAQPVVSNLTALTAQLQQPGSLGNLLCIHPTEPKNWTPSWATRTWRWTT